MQVADSVIIRSGGAEITSRAWTALEDAVAATSKGEVPGCASLAPLEQSTREALEREWARAAQRQNSVAQRAMGAMSDFRSHYPHETVDFDVSIASAGEYRELHRRVADDDLPRFEKEFKEYLNQNTIRDIASFAAQLNKQEKPYASGSRRLIVRLSRSTTTTAVSSPWCLSPPRTPTSGSSGPSFEHVPTT